MTVSSEELNSLKKNPAVLRIYGQKTKLEKQGREYVGRCPFHSEATPSFHVSQDKTGAWAYICFGCQESGDVVRYVQKTDNVNFTRAVKQIQEAVGDTNWKEKQHVDQVFRPLEETKEYKTFSLAEYKKLEDALESSQLGREWLLKERGIAYETAKKLHIGFRQDLGKIAGIPNQDIAASGWVSFPSIDDGKVISIKYRSIVRKAFSRQPGMKTTLFGLDRVDFFEPVFVVEGECDAACLVQAGFNAVSLPNASFNLTPEMRDKLLEAESIVLAGDCDGGAGVKAMERLKLDFGDRATLIRWPDGYKDANEVFLKYNKRDLDKFRQTVSNLISESKSQPMPGVYSLTDIMSSSKEESLVDHPDRFRFPWDSVDKMAILMPGSVAFSTATNTGMGKTIFWMNASLFGGRKNKEVVLNYQCELSPSEFANAVAAHVLTKDRNNLTKDDYNRAASLLKGVRYYVGSDPTIIDADKVLDLIESAIKRFGLTVVVLDHLNFICRSAVDEYGMQSRCMQRIKNMSRIYGIKFIVLGQPRKADQKSKGKELHISDTKGSSSQGDDADAIYFLHREVVKNIDPANPPMDEYDPETDIRLKKGRSKGKGSTFARLYYQGSCATFLELSKIEDTI